MTTWGLMCESGGYAGLAQAGVFASLPQSTTPTKVVCCGPGTLPAFVWASGGDVLRFSEVMKEIPWRRVRSQERQTDELARLFARGARFEDLKHPLTIVAADMVRLEPVIFDTGPVWPAIAASFRLPGLHVPLQTEAGMLADGGIFPHRCFEVAQDHAATVATITFEFGDDARWLEKGAEPLYTLLIQGRKAAGPAAFAGVVRPLQSPWHCADEGVGDLVEQGSTVGRELGRWVLGSGAQDKSTLPGRY